MKIGTQLELQPQWNIFYQQWTVTSLGQKELHTFFNVQATD